MATRGCISAHGQYPPAAEVGLDRHLSRIPRKMLTSFGRFASGNDVINCMIVPCSIHGETIIKSYEDLAAPINGNRFGCLNCFHSTTSRQKFYRSRQYVPDFCAVGTERVEGRTLSILVRSTPEGTRSTLTATLEPRYIPPHTSALPPLPDGDSPIVFTSSVIAYEDGNNLCSRHIFLSITENLSRW